ncbi:putative Glyoxalase-like_dom domain-containing protein [Hyphomicrobiales bacterium]|nr:putative Glyoxalase-like_dom domain-containing protein [Hyphomicrobiales bacterium]
MTIDPVSSDAVWLDHVAHMVPDLEAACAALEAMGFFLSPLSIQSAPPAPGERPVPTGTANRCVMLGRGYIEVLGKVAETPSAANLTANVQRYVGVHLVAFGAADINARAALLDAAGFSLVNIAQPQRAVGTDNGEATARFQIAVPPRGAMKEAGMFFVRHMTRDLVWQPRWVRDANAVEGLSEVLLHVADLAEARERYERFLGCAPAFAARGCVAFRIGEDWVSLLSDEGVEEGLGPGRPSAPSTVGYVLHSRDVEATRAAFARGGFKTLTRGDFLQVQGGPVLGADIFVGQRDAVPSWRTA